MQIKTTMEERQRLIERTTEDAQRLCDRANLVETEMLDEWSERLTPEKAMETADLMREKAKKCSKI